MHHTQIQKESHKETAANGDLVWEGPFCAFSLLHTLYWSFLESLQARSVSMDPFVSFILLHQVSDSKSLQSLEF